MATKAELEKEISKLERKIARLEKKLEESSSALEGVQPVEVCRVSPSIIRQYGGFVAEIEMTVAQADELGIPENRRV